MDDILQSSVPRGDVFVLGPRQATVTNLDRLTLLYN